MARSQSTHTDTAVARFVQQQLAPDEAVTGPTLHVMTVRVDAQTVADLEDLAGRLDITRSALARALIEAGIEEAEAELERLQGGHG